MDLKVCPFCGNEDLQVINSYSEGYYVACPVCISCGPSCGTYEEAVKAWNRRAPDAK